MPEHQNGDHGFSLELRPDVASVVCNHCGHSFKGVNGFRKKDDWADSIYFATLQTGHHNTEAGLTVSIGKWWDDSDSALAERSWVYMGSSPLNQGAASICESKSLKGRGTSISRV